MLDPVYAVIMLSDVILSAVILSAVMLSVVAPLPGPVQYNIYGRNFML